MTELPMTELDEQAAEMLVTMDVEEALAFLGMIEDDYPGKFTLGDRAVQRWIDHLEFFNMLDVKAGYYRRTVVLDVKDLAWPPTMPQLLLLIRKYHHRRHEWIHNYLEAAQIAAEQGEDERAAWARGQAEHWASTAEATL
jgi:hypothetical protein